MGYDSRTSGSILSKAVASGLASTGCNVFDGGYAPTPALQYAVKHFQMDGAIIVTASHNPPQYNGINWCPIRVWKYLSKRNARLKSSFSKKRSIEDTGRK
jgi:phosphomannomutase/phosphoglucomutase